MTRDHDDVMEVMARLGDPAIMLKAARSDNPLASCLGGIPILPEGADVPHHPEAGSALAFVGQINLAELPGALAAEFGIPSRGLLQLFHYWNEGWIEDYAEPNHATLWYPAPDSRSWQPAPHAPTISPTRLVLAPQHGHSWVSRERLAATGRFTEGTLDEFYRHGPPFHQLGGAPKIIQFDPIAERMTPAPHSMLDRLRGRPAPPIEPWRLLWQIDSDERVGLNWIDGGLFHLMIREHDLQAGNLDSVIGQLQTY